MPLRLPAALHPRSSLRARFALLIGGSGLALALVTATVVDAYQRAQLVDVQGQAMRREALLLGRNLEAALQQHLQQLRHTAAHPLLGSGLVEEGDARLLLENLRAQQPALAWIGLVDAAGRVKVGTNALLQGSDVGAERWFIESLKAPWAGPRRPAGALTTHLGLVDGQPPRLIDLGVPLIDIQGRTAGVLAARLRWDWLEALHRSMQAPDASRPGFESLVLDRDGRVLLGPAPWLDQPLAVPGLEALRAGAAPLVLAWPGDGEHVTAWAAADAAAPAGEVGLSVLVRQPAELAFRSADVLRRRLLLLGAAGTLAFIALSIWMANRVARPIRGLSAAAQRVINDEPPDFVAIPPRRDDEVAELARALRALHAELSRRLAEQRRATERLETLFDQLQQASTMARVGGWTLDLQTRQATWTDEMARIYDLPVTVQPTPELALSCFHGEHRARLQQALQPLLRDGEPAYDLELQLRTPAGHVKWVRAYARATVRDGHVVRLEGMTQDITERRAAQEALRELNAQLERRVAARTAELREANDELDAFAYAVSHDLRAPLRAMSGFSQALIEDLGPRLDAAAHDHLDQIVHASQRMGELIEGLLALSRSVRGALRTDEVDLSALATMVIAELRRADPARQVEVDIQPGLQAMGDRRMLAAMLANLLGNAWKYTGRTDAPRISLRAVDEEGERWFVVADNGAGFDMAHAGRLFKVFARMHRQDEFPGLGIGLATVQRIVRRHGGRIVAEAVPGVGATFRFTLRPAPAAMQQNPMS